jgi:hypothetical protein
VKLEVAVRSWAERSDAEHAAWSALGTANVETISVSNLINGRLARAFNETAT